MKCRKPPPGEEAKAEQDTTPEYIYRLSAETEASGLPDVSPQPPKQKEYVLYKSPPGSAEIFSLDKNGERRPGAAPQQLTSPAIIFPESGHSGNWKNRTEPMCASHDALPLPPRFLQDPKRLEKGDTWAFPAEILNSLYASGPLRSRRFDHKVEKAWLEGERKLFLISFVIEYDIVEEVKPLISSGEKRLTGFMIYAPGKNQIFYLEQDSVTRFIPIEKYMKTSAEATIVNKLVFKTILDDYEDGLDVVRMIEREIRGYREKTGEIPKK